MCLHHLTQVLNEEYDWYRWTGEGRSIWREHRDGKAQCMLGPPSGGRMSTSREGSGAETDGYEGWLPADGGRHS